jgi:hypothetical protein
MDEMKGETAKRLLLREIQQEIQLVSTRQVRFSDWQGFTYPPEYGPRVFEGRGKGTTSQTLVKPVPLTQVAAGVLTILGLNSESM